MSSLSFALMVRGAPFSSQCHQTAINFTKAIFAEKHRLSQVFFYGDAVYVASVLNSPPSDENDLTELWSALSLEYQFELFVCVAAASRRGILCPEEAKLNKKAFANLHPTFKVSGVGSFINGAINNDKTIVFNP